MKRAVLISGHFPDQKRRASLLWLSDAMQADGFHVTHATVGYSWLSVLYGDRRLKALDDRPLSGHRRHSSSLSTVFGLSPIHPFSTRNKALDAFLRPLHSLFPAWWAPRLRTSLGQADLVIIESGPPIMLAPMVRRLAPNARMIYRMNDDMRLLGLPRFLCNLEARHAPLFDCVSTASPHLARRLGDDAHVELHPMGIPHDRVTSDLPNPFRPCAFREAVCAGTTQLDVDALVRIATARPNWRLHVLGRLKSEAPKIANLHFHGEQSFDTTLAYIAHADIGLAPYLDAPGMEYQTTNSNRILLYRHFGLPILGPDRLCHPSVPLIIGYSSRDALDRCENAVRTPEHIPDWTELFQRIKGAGNAQNGVTAPAPDNSTEPATL